MTLLKIFPGVLFLLILSGCATHISVDYDKEITFSDYETFAVQGKSEKSTEDARLDSPLIDKRIATALEEKLAAKGFLKKPVHPDFKVTYQINLKQEIATDQNSFSMGFGTGSRRSAFGLGYSFPVAEVESHELVMLTIDIVSGEKEALIWRGTSTRRMFKAATPEKIDRFFQKLVGEILEKFPPSQ